MTPPTAKAEPPASIVEVAVHTLRSTLLSDPHTSAAAATATRVEWWAHARPPPGHPGHQLHFDVDETRLRKVKVGGDEGQCAICVCGGGGG